jgi:pyridinium-3,5-biscarboxylic acid mononucleotide sulfurtransferase
MPPVDDLYGSPSNAERLLASLSQYRQVAVAFSGGVDSSVVAAAAHRVLGDQAIAVTADSPSVARYQIENACRVAREIGIEHRIVKTDELALSEYRRNDGQRCFFCKQTLYRALSEVIKHIGVVDSGQSIVVLSGTNYDDLGDHRPGIRAGQLAGVVTPLADLGLTKTHVRQIAAEWNLSVQDLPASPCLSSRLAYGLEVTEERLERIELAENWLHQNGFSDIRVRLHSDDLARLEVDPGVWSRLQQPELLGELNSNFRNLGFKFITLDLQGRRSGSLNDVLVSISQTPVGKSNKLAQPQ